MAGSLFGHDFSVEPSGTQLGLCVGGLALSVLAGVVLVTSGWVFPSVSTGHYVLPAQEILSKGPYGQIRHPLYAGAFLVWFSLALTFSNLPVLLITLLYVIPSYLIYIRAEEEMLLRHLGDAYARYVHASECFSQGLGDECDLLPDDPQPTMRRLTRRCSGPAGLCRKEAGLQFEGRGVSQPAARRRPPLSAQSVGRHKDTES